ncbi:MATE family efflux transporter [Thalassococcus sp. CAU 1522]|uniref:MATE family efflux transporter n=1 Tax=Thalassococcus arenae TaxID=2851652 RepID=A0ABS6N8H6_9RHOB|nr:MATE family efflux transporter [Thalassococcus arenae]MBV2360103.1 MATE family efflux transporter [Thalassococcus arenae]
MPGNDDTEAASKRDLNSGPVGHALFRVSAPMSIGILGVLSVGLADAAFLARAGQTELAAIGFIYPAIIALTSLAIGMGAGTSAVVSQALGRSGGSDETSARLALHALIFAFALGIAVALVFHFAAPFVFRLMGAKGAVMEGILTYTPWWCASFAPMVAGMGLNAVFRAGGESRIAATVMTLQSLINIALDPIFIFGFWLVPALGIEGAGIATFIARLLGAAGLLVFAMRTGRLSLSRDCLRGLDKTLARVTRIGAPAALSNAINPLGLSFVTAAVATLGDAAVGGFGAATRVQSLFFVPMLALSAGIGPVVGQAWGADRRDRAQSATALTFLVCLGYGAVLCAALLAFAPWVAQLVTNGEAPAGYASQYLRWVSVGFFGYGILVTANAAMNARDRALWSMSLSAGRIVLVYVPLAWAGVMVFGYAGILGAALLANLLAAAAAILLCRAVGLLPRQPEPVETAAQRLPGD